MLQTRLQQILNPFLLASLFFLCNTPAFFYPIWLVPELVFWEAACWSLLAVLAVWILRRDRQISIFLANCRRNWMIFPFLLFSGLSIYWSVYREISVSRWLILVATIIAGGYIGTQYSLKEIIKYLSAFGVFVLLLSTIFVFLFPKIGVMNYYSIQGAWKGPYWHKNHMGIIAAFANLLFLINLINSLISRDKYILIWSSLYFYSVVFIYKTDSVASYMTTLLVHGVLLLAFLWLKFKGRLRKSHYLVFTGVLALASIILLANLEGVFGIFNRSTSLTGRVPMWAHLFDTYFSKRPIWGYGFNAFWYIGSHRLEIGLAAGYPDPIVIADNGFIDILINTGYAGLILFMLFYCCIWWRSINYARRATDVYGFFPLLVLLYSLVANITWSLIFENENFLMLVLISVMFSLAGTSLTHPEAANSSPS